MVSQDSPEQQEAPEPVPQDKPKFTPAQEKNLKKANRATRQSSKSTMEIYVKMALVVLTICYFLNKYGVFDSIKNQVM